MSDYTKSTDNNNKHIMNHIWIVLIILLLSCMGFLAHYAYETFSLHASYVRMTPAPEPKSFYNNVYMAQPTKCFDCENSLPDNLKYMGGPSKCFDCEGQFKNAGANADLVQPSKCYDCEQEVQGFGLFK